MKVELKEVQETLLIPLSVRVNETKSSEPRIKDEKAVELASKLEYDFSKFNQRMTHEGVIERTLILDYETQNFIEKNQDAVCISLGCGLDTRYHRIRHHKVNWYNIDFPEVIALRKSLLFEGKNVHLIGKSVLDMTWTDDIETEGKSVLIIIEGLLMYFTEIEVIQLLGIIRNKFPECTLLIEIMHPFFAKQTKHHDTVKHTDAVFKWGIASGKEMESLNEGLSFQEEWNLFDKMKKRNKVLYWFCKIGFLRRMGEKIVKLEMK